MPRADFFVQHHRFEIVQDFGCQAAIYPSTLAIILIWLPPLLLCSISFMYFGNAPLCFSKSRKVVLNSWPHRTRITQHAPPTHKYLSASVDEGTPSRCPIFRLSALIH